MASRTPSQATVRVRAIVTLHDSVRQLTFVQDGTAGLFVVPAAPGLGLSPGQVVDITGTAVITERGATITGATLAPSGRAPLPEPVPLPAAAGRLTAVDARWVFARGVVRRVRTSGSGAEVTLRTTQGTLTLVQPAGAGPELTPVDSIISAQGVLSHVIAADRSVQRLELLVASRSIRIESPPADDLFTAAEVRVEGLREIERSGTSVRRVKLSGVVTRQRPGRSLYLRTATGPVYVETDSTAPVSPGDLVEVVGFPDQNDYAPFISEAVFRRIGGGPVPEPVVATLGELLDGRYDADLVRIDATYIGGEQGHEEFTLALQDDELIFNAHVLLDRAEALPGRLRPGQRLQLTGICSVIVDSFRITRSFRLHLRDAADVTILNAPPMASLGARSPWWAWASVALAVAGLGAAGLAYRRGRAQEQTIRGQIARESSLKARFDDLFDRSSEILIVHDRRGRLSTLNRAGEQATGYSREELRMLDPNWVFGSDYLDAITRLIEEGAGSVSRTFRSELVPRGGARVPIDVQASVLVVDGHVVGVTAIARDLSERDRLENELRQAQKMEAVGRLATGIAHDFNNVITVLLGYSDELIEAIPEGSDEQRSAKEIRRAAERASALTQQLLAFSRRRTPVAQTVDLNLIVANMEDLVRRLIGPEIRLDFSLAPGLATIRVDGAQIGQVLMNLAVNARDAMPSGGTVHIETANVELGAENVDVIPGPHVMLSVGDSGAGMTPEVRKRLFEPFFTTKETGQGTGLGLSMVHAIVRQGGGHIMVESTPGKGSTFRIYFPRQGDVAEASLPALTPPHVAAVKGEGVILLAEDDRSVRRLVSTELRRRGFSVIEAEDGRAALDLFAEHKDRVDVLVTDVVMPRMNGADLAKAAEKLRPGLKILFISGHPERAGAGLDPTGVVNLLMKPFTADTLAARINDLMTGVKGDGGGGG